MRNIKFVSIFAACGFVLSFVFGFFSHSSFLKILLRALIVCLIFVILGILISFVFNRFLDDSDSDVSLSDLAAGGAGDGKNVGQSVDLVIEDEALPASDTDNHFVVGENHQMLKDTDIKEDNLNAAVDDVAPEVQQFVPLRKVENSVNFSGKEAVSPSAVSSVEDVENLDDNIDTLPDMESLELSQEGGTDEDDSDSGMSSVFDSSVGSYKKSDDSKPDVKDASLIAKAISTALAGDDS